jgi:hypothetical protein
MGQMLVRAIAERTDAVLAGATERPGHPWIGRDLGECLGGAGQRHRRLGRSAAGFRRRAGGAGFHDP